MQNEIPIIHKKILLMYLGGEPKTSNLLNHIITLNTEFNNYDNFYIVIHPMTFKDYTINSDFYCIFNPNNIFIVDENHHLTTSWGTHSLTCATLMMMQYANIQNNNNFFDKYVLLSSSCMPLFSFDEIYNQLVCDNKSWIDGGNPLPIKKFYHSQWLILDKSHAMFFFNKENNKFMLTYTKKRKFLYFCKVIQKSVTTEKIDIINNEFTDQMYYNFFNNHKHGCEPSDEYFIGTFVFHKFYTQNNTKKQFDDNFRLINKKTVIDRLQNIPIEIKSMLKQISSEIKTEIEYIKPVNFNTININSYQNSEGLYNNVNSKLFPISVYLNSHLVMPTFLNFDAFSIAPDNIIRNFNLFKLDLNKFIKNTDLPTKILTELYSYYQQHNINCTSDEKDIYSKIATSITSHPVEYSCWTLKNMVNIFLFLIIFKCFILNSSKEKIKISYAIYPALLLYQKIIFREFTLTKYDYTIVYEYDEYTIIASILDQKILEESVNINKKIGTFIDNNVILSAYSSGSLFIRKCYDNSLIHLYSHILKTCKYNNPISGDSEPIPSTISKEWDISYLKKYLLYKNKYLKLSNNK